MSFTEPTNNMQIDEEIDNTYDYILECEIATSDEILLVTSICGYNIEALNSILYSRTGYRSLEQLQDMEA